MTQEELEIAKAACCVGTIWDEYEGTEDFDHMVGKRVQHLIELVRKSQPSLPSDLDEAAWAYVKKKYGIVEPEKVFENEEIAEDFKAGAQYAAPRWFSVDERLPEVDEEVIVLSDELGTAPIYKIAFGHIVDVEHCIDYNGWNCPGVKYWMPCPEIPNE